MTEQSTAFAPDWVSPPGETLQDLIEERDWSQNELATRLGLSEKHINQLINAKVPLSTDVALRLERVLGNPADFWLNREARYQHHKARLEAIRAAENWTVWLDKLPTKDLMACGAIPKVRLAPKNKATVVLNCLQFFGVASPNEWRLQYSSLQASFRRSDTQESDTAAVIAWLRLGEQQAESQTLPPYSKTRFRAALKQARALTCQPPQQFQPRLQNLLQEAGVLLVLVPAIPRARVSGVARWLNGKLPIIQLSLYGKANDKFWFNLFHEAAHLLLHADNKAARQSVYLDNDQKRSQCTTEQEADTWAAQWLIPKAYEPELPPLRTKKAVKDFAKRIGIHPGIVVGRLQHDGLIKPSWMNDLKASFRFKKG